MTLTPQRRYEILHDAEQRRGFKLLLSARQKERRTRDVQISRTLKYQPCPKCGSGWTLPNPDCRYCRKRVYDRGWKQGRRDLELKETTNGDPGKPPRKAHVVERAKPSTVSKARGNNGARPRTRKLQAPPP